MDVLASSDGEFHIKLHIRNKADNFTWTLVALYGATQDEFKAEFLHELVNLAKDNPYPILIGGDFNLLRFPNEKSRGRFDDHWPFLFNAVIDSLDLREVSMIGRQFTWANSLPEPTYEKLDRVLMDTDWESKFPMVSVRALPRIEAISDHAPILLTTGLPRPQHRRKFKIELGWLLRDGFHDMVKEVWEKPVAGPTPIHKWNNKMRALRKFLGGWARHTVGILRKEKLRLSSIIDELEALAEVRPLSEHEIEIKSHSNAQIASMLREEELKWYQHSNSQFILKGDANTRYFHGVANGRLRKKIIHSLQQDEGTIEGHEQLKSYITNYYKNLFGAPEEGNFSMDESRTNDIRQVSDEEKSLLTAPYSEEEVRKATAFMQGRYILDGVVILHETVHELHRKKLNGVVLKIDFEKAYDKVKWPFLQQTLRMKGFSAEWRAMIHSFVSGGSVAIKVNDDIGHYFQTKKGLRQGDSVSPMLFNIVADMLAIMIERAKVDGQIEGVVNHLVDGGVSILQYADDTILFMDHDLEKARNLKLILSAFEQLSGLKINFHKSELFCFGEAQDEAHLYAELFGCGLGQFPITYLGIPIHYRRLTNAEWKHIEERLQKRLSSWKGSLQMYRDSSFMVLSTTRGESRPVYGDVYTIGGYGEGYFYPAWVAT
nr:uncharacterized protein LOC123497248 [Aegilops tauschii subsp. strangulata]